MNTCKQLIYLNDIDLSEENPRHDMGDIDELARSFGEAGEPIIPIIVARDGGRYKVIDGERRVRAMRQLGTDHCDAMVYPNYLAAHAAAAMLKTDKKKMLEPDEEARGFQTMITLGCTDEEVSEASGLEVEKVRRVRRVATELPEQSSLDAMLVAADVENAEDRAKVLACSNRFDAERKARELKSKRNKREKVDKVMEALRMMGVPTDHCEVRDEATYCYSVPRAKEEGLNWLEQVSNAKQAAAELDGYDPALVWATADLAYGTTVSLETSEAKHESEDEDDGAKALKLRALALNAYAERLKPSMFCWLAEHFYVIRDAQEGTGVGALVQSIIGKRDEFRFEPPEDEEVAVAAIETARTCRLSYYELMRWLDLKVDRQLFRVSYDGENLLSDSWARSAWKEAWDALVAAGWPYLEHDLSTTFACCLIVDEDDSYKDAMNRLADTLTADGEGDA